ncbi:MAG: hypothetical protein RR777_01285 [Christensenellaceae bacterium]
MPMKLKEIFKRTMTSYKQNFPKLFVPLMLFQLVLLLPLLFFTMPGTVSVARSVLLTLSQIGGGDKIYSILSVLIIVALVAVFLSPLMVGDVVYVINRDYHNQKAGFKQAFAHGKKRYADMLKSYFAIIVLILPVILAIVLLLLNLNLADIACAKNIVLITLCGLLLIFFLFGIVFVPYTVAIQRKKGFDAVLTSYQYAYKGNFLSNFGRILIAAAMVVAAGSFINWLSQLPFADLFYLYLENPLAALSQPLMIFAILLSVAAIIIITLVFPFWYAFTYHTYKNAEFEYNRKYKGEKINESNCKCTRQG